MKEVNDSMASNGTCNSCGDIAARYEWYLCGMGDIWGKLQSRESLLAWWLTRHAVYVGLVTLLLVTVPKSIFAIVVVLLVAHLYKLGRFLAKSAYQKRQERKKLTVNQLHNNDRQIQSKDKELDRDIETGA